MEIYLIRHTTPLIAKGLIYGRLDVPLAETFAQEKAALLAELPAAFDVVYSSPATRCRKLAEAIDSAYLIEEALSELDFGDWEGLTWDTVNRAESEEWMKDFLNLSPPNGESMLQMEKRVMAFWQRLCAAPHRSAALVTHGGVIRILLAQERKIALQDVFELKVGFAEVFKLQASSFQP